MKDNNDGAYRIDKGENYTGFFEMNFYNGHTTVTIYLIPLNENRGLTK